MSLAEADLREQGISNEMSHDSWGTEQQRLTRYTNHYLTHHALVSLVGDLKVGTELAYEALLRTKGEFQNSQARNTALWRREVAAPSRTSFVGVSGKKLLAEFESVNSQLGTLVWRNVRDGLGANNIARFEELNRRSRMISVNLARGAQSGHVTDPEWFAEEAKASRVTADEVLASLPTDSALLDYVVWRHFDPRRDEAKQWSEPHYGVYIVKRTGGIRFFDLGVTAPIDSAIQDFRRGLSKPDAGTGQDLGQQLARKTFEPLISELANVNHLVVAPDGLLNLIPFAALRLGDAKLLLERFQLSYASSGRDLARFKAKGKPNGDIVVLSNPEYAGVASVINATVRPLPGTAGEASAIATLYKSARQYTQAGASESALKTVSRPNILHIATHGMFLGDSLVEDTAQDAQRNGRDIAVMSQVDNPLLRSALILAGGEPGAKNDGVLTALEAATLDLAGTQLVVLSACETGVGEVKNGQGVFGLRQAFAVAGAETVVMSLWKVDDNATKDLMTNYYQRLRAGEGRGEALRQAQLALLKQPQTAHPYYWASFISSGQWAPLRQ